MIMKPKPFTYTLKQLITTHFNKQRRPNVHNLCKFLWVIKFSNIQNQLLPFIISPASKG